MERLVGVEEVDTDACTLTVKAGTVTLYILPSEDRVRLLASYGFAASLADMVQRYLPATLLQRGNNVVAQTPLGELTDLEECPLPSSYPGGECDVLLRADDIVHDDHAPVQAQIVRKSFRGSEFLYTLRLASGHTVLAHVPSHHDHALGEWIGIRAQVDHVVTFPREQGTTI